ncbi:MAG: acetyl-CoA carboxylase biotin carboxyl carrier protein [Vicinamibacterales bacterium]
MDLDDIRRILDLVKEHDLSEFELEVDSLKVKIRKSGGTHVVHAPALAPYPSLPAVAMAGAASAPRPVEPRLDAGAAGAADADLAIVTSPIVGTFYRASQPGAPPFVERGAAVKKGQVLCIIEAMKLMNEIECDHDGEIVAVYAENSQPVQYGERLFAIRVS